ncbi:hypothetical protein M0811_06470 [Anaeramoeba ignava]|uniref:Uncharacterized protein n=1 Tax=Anaeramoeba ignava TaxID=1746090 RepID=A0A9Q0LR92_ANAIG|nr:hypothetical protein M0811_06470 [Anaeramoeba ignava]
MSALLYSYYEQDQRLSKLVTPLFTVLIVITFILNLVACVIDPENQVFNFVFHGSTFTLLVILLTFFGTKIYRILIQFNLKSKTRLRAKTFMNLVIVISSLFIIRSIYDIANAVDNSIPNWIMDNDKRFLLIHLLFISF